MSQSVSVFLYVTCVTKLLFPLSTWVSKVKSDDHQLCSVQLVSPALLAGTTVGGAPLLSCINCPSSNWEAKNSAMTLSLQCWRCGASVLEKTSGFTVGIAESIQSPLLLPDILVASFNHSAFQLFSKL